MLTDAVIHIISVVLITGSIILVGAIVLHPTGQKITAPAQLAEMLVPIMGNAAKYIMGVALLGARILFFIRKHTARYGVV